MILLRDIKYSGTLWTVLCQRSKEQCLTEIMLSTEMSYPGRSLFSSGLNFTYMGFLSQVTLVWCRKKKNAFGEKSVLMLSKHPKKESATTITQNKI